MINIKEISPKDKQNLDIYCNLAKEIWSEYYKDKFSQDMLEYQFDFLKPEIIKEQINFDGVRFFIIFKNNIPIGFFELKTREDYIEISKIFILKNYRFQKNGKKSFELIKDYVKEKNFNKIVINVDENELEILKVFDSWGFIDIKQMARYIGKRVYIYTRNLEFILE